MKDTKDQNIEWTRKRAEVFIQRVEKKIKKRYKPLVMQVIKSIKKYNIKINPKVLDIGCVPGILLFELKKLVPDIRILGIDSSRIMVDTAKKKAEEYNIKKYEFKKGFAEEIPLPDKSVDVVVCYDSLHDFMNTKKTIEEVYRILLVEGIFILKDINGTYPKWKRQLQFIPLLFKVGLKNTLRYIKKGGSGLNPNQIEIWMVNKGFEVNLLEKKKFYLIIGKKHSNK